MDQKNLPMLPPVLLQHSVEELLSFLQNPMAEEDVNYEFLEVRLSSLRIISKNLEINKAYSNEDLATFIEWFKKETQCYLGQSKLINRAREWPEGYPGDFRTLEAIYKNKPCSVGIGNNIDKYFLTRSLAVAIRSRLDEISTILNDKLKNKRSTFKWLNLGCGPCRELLKIREQSCSELTIYCVDIDQNALNYTEGWLTPSTPLKFIPLKENVLRFANSKRTIKKYGKFDLIYSLGVFDYIKDEYLTKLLAGLYNTLETGGSLIATFKDAERYETFDYHWLTNWNYFFQRTSIHIQKIFKAANIPNQAINMQREKTGIIIFYTITKL